MTDVLTALDELTSAVERNDVEAAATASSNLNSIYKRDEVHSLPARVLAAKAKVIHQELPVPIADRYGNVDDSVAEGRKKLVRSMEHATRMGMLRSAMFTAGCVHRDERNARW